MVKVTKNVRKWINVYTNGKDKQHILPTQEERSNIGVAGKGYKPAPVRVKKRESCNQ